MSALALSEEHNWTSEGLNLDKEEASTFHITNLASHMNLYYISPLGQTLFTILGYWRWKLRGGNLAPISRLQGSSA